MSATTIAMTQALQDYLLGTTVREPELLARLRQETAALPSAGMQISPEQGQLMRLLIELTGARHAHEAQTAVLHARLTIQPAVHHRARERLADGRGRALGVDGNGGSRVVLSLGR